MLCHILEQLMFYYMNEAVWAYQNMFITYYNENWDYSQKMLAKSLKEITKKCFRNLKDTKVYDFDRFSPFPFRKEKKTGLFRKIRFPPLKFIRKLQRACMEKEMKYTSWIVLLQRETEDES